MSKKQQKKGAALIEYALLIVMLVMVAVGGATFLGGAVSQKFKAIGSDISNGCIAK